MTPVNKKTVMYTESVDVEECGPNYYDEIYGEGSYDTDRYKRVYDCVYNMLITVETGFPKKVDGEPLQVLELGCGTGAFASMLLHKNVYYRGVDFSREALRQCPQHVQPFVVKKNIYGVHCWRVSYNVVVAIEVMEHVNDLAITNKIAQGKVVIFTLPNFTCESHLRVYPDAEYIKERFKGFIKWLSIETIDMTDEKKIHVCRGIKL